MRTTNIDRARHINRAPSARWHSMAFDFFKKFARGKRDAATCKFFCSGSLVAQALLVAIGSVSDKDEVGEPESARVAGCEGEGMRWGFG